MIRKLLIPSAFLATAMLVLSSCGGSGKPGEAANTDTLAAADSMNIQTEFFQVPLPGELFRSLKDYGAKGKAGILNPVENIAGYTTSAKMAINFGVYSADLFYASTFNQKADVMRYFENLKKLSNDLGMSSVITDATMKRIETNIGNSDSLNQITNDIFMETSIKLENSDQGATLALLVAGGLAETIYLSTQMLTPFNEKAASAGFMAEQKYPVDNLFHFFGRYEGDERVAAVKKDMEALKQVFDSLKEEPHQAGTSKTGKRVLGGSTKLILTAADFNRLAESAAALRTNLISASK